MPQTATQSKTADREVMLDAKAILARTGLREAMQYADFGCGMTGHFALPAAKLVGEDGKVYAVDILKSALATLERRAQMLGFSQFQPVWGDIERPGGVHIKDHRLDVVSLVNMSALLQKTPTVLREAYRVLSARGVLLVVDWKRACGTFGPEKRVPAAAMQQHLESSGWEVTKSFDAGPCHWGLVAKKRLS